MKSSNLDSTATAETSLAFVSTIKTQWGLSDSDICTLFRLKASELTDCYNKPFKFDLDRLERAGYLMSIDSILSGIFTEDQKRAWLRSRDTTTNFGGATVLEKLLSGRVRDLYDVESWLKSRIELL
ncbi:hypothetical protein [Marinobacter sp. P4B1]|uniref:hypothetical protein n=1 Tax=Marinobacter sp. P4B1 TaxID=1119533 RepID=UPI0011AA2EDB|nr:hypothetical protein [Marinobacter sp. P4B1]